MLRPIFWPVIMPSLLFAISIGTTVPVFVLAALQLGSGDALASAVVTLMGAISLVFTVPGGYLIDRIGDRKAMTVGTSAAVLVTGITVVSLAAPLPQPVALLLYVISLMLSAPIQDIFRLARQAAVADRMPPHHMGKAMTALGGTMRVGNLVGPLFSSLLLLFLPLWSVFVFSALCAILAVVVINIPALNRGFDESRPATSSLQRAEEMAGEIPGRRTRRSLDVDWRAVALAGISILVLSVARVLQPMLVQLWGASIGLHEAGIALLVAVGAAIELVLMFPGGYIKDLLGRVAVLVLCLAIFGAGFLVMGLVPTVVGLVVSVVVMAVGNGLGAGVNMTIGADLSPRRGRAKFLGIWAVFTNAGQLGGPAVVSVLLLVTTLPVAILAAGGMTLAGAVWTVLLGRRMGLPKGVAKPLTGITDQVRPR